MNDLAGSPGELRFTMTITRAGTGKVEHFDLVGKVGAGEAEALGLTASQKDEDPASPEGMPDEPPPAY